MMDKHFATAVEKYMALYEAIRAKVDDGEVALTILREAAKDHRMQMVKEERESRNGEPATPKQIEYLKDLGVGMPENLTKAEASKMIDVALEREE